jgi:hypothetical protein
MKLTTEQVEDIENILNQKGIKYDDLKFEIVDHIASEIENEMEKSDTNFVETIALVFSRWEPEFKPTNIFFFFKSYPKFYKDKLLKIIKIQGLSTAVLSSLFLILFYFFSDVIQSTDYLFWLKKILQISYVVTILTLLIIKFLNSKVTTFTFYRSMLDTRFPVFFCWLFILFNNNIPKGINSQHIFVVMIGFVLIYFISTIYFGLKHYQFVQKIKSV